PDRSRQVHARFAGYRKRPPRCAARPLGSPDWARSFAAQSPRPSIPVPSIRAVGLQAWELRPLPWALQWKRSIATRPPELPPELAPTPQNATGRERSPWRRASDEEHHLAA